jgi:hypothetical protein
MTTNPSRSVDDYDIPPNLADTIQTAFGLNEPPATLGDWSDTTAHLLDNGGITAGFEDMCTADDSRHEAQIDGEVQHFHCVLDTLLLPFVVEDQSTFDVRSRSPGSDEIVELAVSGDTVEVTPSEAVMSFGVATDVEIPTDGAIEPALAYTHLCPYINAFPSQAEYEQWASETPEAATMVLSLADGFELAQILTQSPQYGSG